MKKNIFSTLVVSAAVILLTAKPVFATTVPLTEAPGTSWISLNSTNNTNFLVHNAADGNNLEFAASSGGTTAWQLFNINKAGNVGVGASVSSGAKFQVTTSSGLWAGRFLNSGADIRFGLQGGYGIFMQSNANNTGYQMRIFKGSALKFEIQHDGKTIIDNSLTAKQIVVKSNVWADYILNKNYDLPTLKYVENYINQNGHLPGIDSEDEIKKNGISVSDMQAKQMGKIEELTLYTIQQQKKIDSLKDENSKLEARLSAIEQKLGL